MSTSEQMELPLINAWMLWELRGSQAVCDVPLPDGTLPVLNTHRMDLAEWQRYLAICAEAASRLTREDVLPCC